MKGYNRYDKYKVARDKAWKAIIDAQITELPINLKKVSETYSIIVCSYNTAISKGLINSEDAVDAITSRIIGNMKYVFVDSTKSEGEIRFNIACGIGHYVLGHKNLNRNNYEASVFARDLLMPAVVLHDLGIVDSSEICRICNVPLLLAKKRANRISELSGRNKFNAHPSERLVSEQFERFIYEYMFQ